MSRIIKTDLNFEREKLIKPFGFKGAYIDELWQAVAYIKTENHQAACPSTQSVLWSDSGVFAENFPVTGNALMLMITARALKLLENRELTLPTKIILPLARELEEYAARLCGKPVEHTFIMNALVCVDTALWMLYAKENGIRGFDELIPREAAYYMNEKHEAIAHIPLISYAVTADEINKILDSGCAILKIKIGAPSGLPNGSEEDMSAMLELDKQRISEIHRLSKGYKTALTKNGRVLYYLDANGRYDSKARLKQLLEHCDKIGALDSVAMIEEPFEMNDKTDVSDLPVIINADESLQSFESLTARLEQGYRAFALKPMAKTLSMSFLMISEIYKSNAEAFVADLTVNPFQATWNKQFAARIKPLSCMNTGCVEINGNQNYITWEAQKSNMPDGFVYEDEKNGAFGLNYEFYNQSGLLFNDNGYLKFFKN